MVRTAPKRGVAHRRLLWAARAACWRGSRPTPEVAPCRGPQLVAVVRRVLQPHWPSSRLGAARSGPPLAGLSDRRIGELVQDKPDGASRGGLVQRFKQSGVAVTGENAPHDSGERCPFG